MFAPSTAVKFYAVEWKVSPSFTLLSDKWDWEKKANAVVQRVRTDDASI